MKIAVIKITGSIDASADERRTLKLLKLNKKNVCVLIDDRPEIRGMIKKVKRYVAAGEIDQETLKELIEKRGKTAGNKRILSISLERIADWSKRFILGNADFKELGIKPFFRLHPPRGGFKKSTKLLWPQGILGWQSKAINQLIKKML